MLWRGRRQWKQAGGFFFSHHIKPKGLSNKMGGGGKNISSKHKYALWIQASPPSSVFHELLLNLELAEKIQYRLSEDVCCLVSLLVANFGQGCESVGLTQTELFLMGNTANRLSHRISRSPTILQCLPPHWEIRGPDSCWGDCMWCENGAKSYNDPGVNSVLVDNGLQKALTSQHAFNGKKEAWWKGSGLFDFLEVKLKSPVISSFFLRAPSGSLPKCRENISVFHIH